MRLERHGEDGRRQGLRHLGPSTLQGPSDPTLSPHPGACDSPTPCLLQLHTWEAHSGLRLVTGVRSAGAGAHE